jgi:hypothetical protein
MRSLIAPLVPVAAVLFAGAALAQDAQSPGTGGDTSSSTPPAASEPAPATPSPASPAETPRAPPQTSTPSADTICRTIGEAAVANNLPVAFFSRLIWQESRFDPLARSSAGAQGIAQFMPQTASWRGLADPFEPIEALREAASYLAELRKTFGNLGLAAAAYNAGPGRVSRWLAGRARLPSETRAYVRIVTGRSADEWASGAPVQGDETEFPAGVPCAEVAKLVVAAAPAHRIEPNPNWAPWGVQLAGNWSQGRLLATYEQLRRKYSAIIGDRAPLVLHARVPGLGYARAYMVRIPENSRLDADRLCARLIKAGAPCAVLRNPRDAS